MFSESRMPGFVVDDEHTRLGGDVGHERMPWALDAGCGTRALAAEARLPHRNRLGRGQDHGEARVPRVAAVDEDESAVRLDGAMHDREAQARLRWPSS